MDSLQQLKQAHRSTWSAGDYDAVAEKVWEVGTRIVSRVGVSAGDEVLDVACGTGNAAIPAAAAGARVTGVDLTPELFEAARARASEAGVEVEWVEGDAEALAFDDASFDVVLSTFGCMFAPRHEVAAAELARVLRPGGRMGLCNWTPEGSIGAFFRTVAGHMPPPPPDFSPPPLWGTEDHVRELFEGTGVELELDRETVGLRFDSIEDAVAMYETKFGPVIKAREALEPEGKWQALREDLASTFEASNSAAEGVELPAEYLVVLGRRGS